MNFLLYKQLCVYIKQKFSTKECFSIHYYNVPHIVAL